MYGQQPPHYPHQQYPYPQYGHAPPPPAPQPPKQHWYHEYWGIFLLLVLFFPAGLWALWTSPKVFYKPLWTAVWAFFWLLAVISNYTQAKAREEAKTVVAAEDAKREARKAQEAAKQAEAEVEAAAEKAKGPSAIEVMQTTTDPIEMLRLARLICSAGGKDDNLAQCTALAITTHAQQKVVTAHLKTQPDHTHGEVMREDQDGYGWKFCSSGRVFDFKKERIDASHFVYTGAIRRGDFNFVRMITLVPLEDGQQIQACGLFTGVMRYKTMAGGMAAAPMIVPDPAGVSVYQ